MSVPVASPMTALRGIAVVVIVGIIVREARP